MARRGGSARLATVAPWLPLRNRGNGVRRPTFEPTARPRQNALASVFCRRWRQMPSGIPKEHAGFRREILMKFTRITVDPKQMGGVPCIRALRVPVATVVGMVADGMTTIDILAAYPDLEREDIQEALHYAANAVLERELPLMAP